MTAAEQAGRLFISSITLVEVDYLIGKKKFPYPTALADLYTLIADPKEPLKVLPLTLAVAQAMGRVPRSEVPDMPDRIIAATAVAPTLRLVSVDADIQGSATLKSIIPVIW